MSKAPAMPMYWDAYLADTTHLTTEEHGAYLLLLAAMWRRNGAVPDCDRDNARILGLTQAKWRKIKTRLIETVSGVRVEDGVILQEKLQKTWKKTQEIIQKNKSNGALGGRPKSSKSKDLEKANGSVSDNPNETLHNHNHNHNQDITPLNPPKGGNATAKKQAPKKRADLLEQTPEEILSQKIPIDLARGFVAHRKKLRKPMTPQAAQIMLKKLVAMRDPVAAVEKSIMNGYQGVFEDDRAQAPAHRSNGSGSSRIDALLRYGQ